MSANQHNAATSNQLSGSWRLIYSNAPEITSLASSGPLLKLGPTYQPLDTATGLFENQASLEVAGCRLQTIIVGTVAIAPLGSVNAVGVVNNNNNRVEVTFDAICFQLDTVFSSTIRPLRKVIRPKLKDSATTATPANDITYLDATLRIVRGGDGSLFLFCRDTNTHGPKMLTLEERNELLQLPNADDAAQGDGGGSSPELDFLFQQRRGRRPLNP